MLHIVDQWLVPLESAQDGLKQLQQIVPEEHSLVVAPDLVSQGNSEHALGLVGEQSECHIYYIQQGTNHIDSHYHEQCSQKEVLAKYSRSYDTSNELVHGQ